MIYKAFADRVVIRPKAMTIESAGLTLMEGDQRQDPYGEVIFVGEGVALNNIKLDIKLEGSVSPENIDKFDQVMARIERVMELQLKGREMRVKVGDIVHYGQYAGTKQMINDELVIIIRECDVFGVITQD